MAPLLERQQLVAITGAVAVLLIVLELVRRRKLREEYSWVWVATAIGIVILALNQGLLKTIGSWIGAASSVSTLFFGAIIFLIALTVQKRRAAYVAKRKAAKANKDGVPAWARPGRALPGR